MIIPTIVFWMLVVNAVICFFIAIKYIITEQDYVETWKERAVSNIVIGLVRINIFLIIGWLLGW
jgi:hypothetical protein